MKIIESLKKVVKGKPLLVLLAVGGAAVLVYMAIYPTLQVARGPIPISREVELDVNYAIVKVYYATDRNKTGSEEPSEYYGSERSDLTYGICEVSIPRNHKKGELESPSIWRLEFRPDPEKHIVLLAVQQQDKEDYFSGLASVIRSSPQKSALIFIHGFNVTFEDAARRTGQMAKDLEFDGAPVFYSWPSKGKTLLYSHDFNNNEWTQAHLRQFLEDVVGRTGAENVYLIAHSMGNRALTRALLSLIAERPELESRFTEIILTAPDIDADTFRDQIVPKFAELPHPVTLYVSSNDKALKASKEYQGYRRIGDSSENLGIFDNVETIDASAIDTNFMGHSYFVEERELLSDMSYIFSKHLRADERFGLHPVDTDAGRYWEFVQ